MNKKYIILISILILQTVLFFESELKNNILDKIISSKSQFPVWDNEYTPGNYLITGTVIKLPITTILLPRQKGALPINLSEESNKFYYKSCKHKIGDNVTYAAYMQRDPFLMFYIKRELC